MSDEEDAFEKWRRERGIPDEEMRRMFSPELRMIHLFEKLSERVDKNADEYRSMAEETQRNIDFIVRQQAQFTTDMQQLRELQTRSEQRWERTEGSIRALLEIVQTHDRDITALADAQAQTNQHIRESQAQTDRQMAETDERLNALINTVERVISERHNGGGRPAEGEGPQGEGQR
jgi:hypothetical protein